MDSLAKYGSQNRVDAAARSNGPAVADRTLGRNVPGSESGRSNNVDEKKAKYLLQFQSRGLMQPASGSQPEAQPWGGSGWGKGGPGGAPKQAADSQLGRAVQGSAAISSTRVLKGVGVFNFLAEVSEALLR